MRPTGHRRHFIAPVVRREPGLKDELVIGEIGLSTDWKTALDGCDVVVHLAGCAHILKENAVDPLAGFRMVNTVGTLNLARWAAAMGVRCFVFISSIGVNGAFTRVGELFEEKSRAESACAANPYAISKWEAE